MFDSYKAHFQEEIPLRPGARYAHAVVLRKTESYGVFKTDGELNTAVVRAGVKDDGQMTRLALFKRKQSTPERLTGRELLRRYGVVLEEDCTYNEQFCGKCPDCVLYGYAIGDSGSEKSKVYVDTAFSLTAYDESHETFTLNAPYESGTMMKEGKTTNRFSEQDHVKPEVYFPSVVTLRDPTPGGLAYVLNNVRRTKLYGAQTTRTGRVANEIVALVFADGEIFSNLRLTQATFDVLKGTGVPLLAPDPVKVQTACLDAARSLVRQDAVAFKFVEGGELEQILSQLDAVFTSEEKLGAFLKTLYAESSGYSQRAGGAEEGKKKGKGAKKPKEPQEPKEG